MEGLEVLQVQQNSQEDLVNNSTSKEVQEKRSSLSDSARDVQNLHQKRRSFHSDPANRSKRKSISITKDFKNIKSCLGLLNDTGFDFNFSENYTEKNDAEVEVTNADCLQNESNTHLEAENNNIDVNSEENKIISVEETVDSPKNENPPNSFPAKLTVWTYLTYLKLLQPSFENFPKLFVNYSLVVFGFLCILLSWSFTILTNRYFWNLVGVTGHVSFSVFLYLVLACSTLIIALMINIHDALEDTERQRQNSEQWQLSLVG